MRVPREQVVGSGQARLYVRDLGDGRPIIVVHGGPDFDHQYLLPHMDRLAEGFRLVYYDQRGRGRSYAGERPNDITMATEVEDLDRVREHLEFGSVALLGHSWGALLAMEYAIRRSDRVSHLILLNTAPVSHAGAGALRRALQARRSPQQAERLVALSSDATYREGDIDADTEFYRVHFGTALRRPEHLEHVVQRLRLGFTKDGIVAARAIEQRLYEQTWDCEHYDLVPQLERLRMPTLIIHGDGDFIPIAEARRIAEAITGSRLVVLADCGHFCYLEQADQVRTTIADFLAPT